MLLHIPGHLTGHVQVDDTRLHGPLSAHYKRAETVDAQAHLRRSRRILPASRQAILDRTVRAWEAVDHESVSQGFKHAGLSLALDGSEDHLLGHE
eukprot:9220147-Alexandrium_andersonii.AAC.1